MLSDFEKAKQDWYEIKDDYYSINDAFETMGIMNNYIFYLETEIEKLKNANQKP